MCGIAGVMTTGGVAPSFAMLDRMEQALAHRGPDGVGRLLRGDTGLLQVRLAIVDLATGDQPLFGVSNDSATGVALVANGEIYNNPDLRRAMEAVPFRTRSDCEPAVFLYETTGVDFADGLRGMYAIAVHDPVRARLVLARDPFGIKPLYYVETPELFAFASEAQALLAAGLGSAEPEPHRVGELLQLKFTTGAATIFPGIQRVLPGETIVIERGRIVSRHRGTALPPGPPEPLPDDPVGRLDKVLFESVSVHLQSDVPYGLFLSGGVDSAALLALMTRAGGRVRALTCGWEGADGVDETAEALRLAALQGASCERIAMGPADFWAYAPRIAACIDDPTADAAVLPSWMLGQAAHASGLKVTLCGEGGDELFGGYARYRKRRAPWRWITRPPRSGGVFGSALAAPGWRDGIEAAETAAGSDLSALQSAQWVDCQEWLPNDLLTKLDRTLMAHGVEGRTPFLDPLVAAFAFALPDASKAGLRTGKLLLRQWLARHFPAAGAWERKKGFKPPVGDWIAARGPQLAELVAAQPGVAAMVPRALVLSCMAQAGKDSQKAWSLLFYALWHSHHVLGVSADGDIGSVLDAARA